MIQMKTIVFLHFSYEFLYFYFFFPMNICKTNKKDVWNTTCCPIRLYTVRFIHDLLYLFRIRQFPLLLLICFSIKNNYNFLHVICQYF